MALCFNGKQYRVSKRLPDIYYLECSNWLKGCPGTAHHFPKTGHIKAKRPHTCTTPESELNSDTTAKVKLMKEQAYELLHKLVEDRNLGSKAIANRVNDFIATECLNLKIGGFCVKTSGLCLKVIVTS